MSALDTALRVLEWANSDGVGRGAPPQGDVNATEQLAHPPLPLQEALGHLSRLTAARLRLGNPPLGDQAPLGVGALVMAAALGIARVPEAARLLLGAVPAPASPIEYVARHGLINPALRFLPEPVADDCRLKSPLTALLNHPASGQGAQALEILFVLLRHPAGRLSLTLQLAQPTSDTEVREWRLELLERLRLSEQDFVIDVYEAVMIYHQTEALEQIAQAHAVITDPIAANNEKLLRDALSVAEWWGPLWTIERANVDQLRARRYLAYPYREGIALYQLARKMRGLT